MCGDTEVSLDQLEEYVNDILAVPLDQSEHTHIELQFKVHVRADVYYSILILPDLAVKISRRGMPRTALESETGVYQFAKILKETDVIYCSFPQRLAVDKSDTYRFLSANKDVNKAKNRYVNVLPCKFSLERC